MKKTLLKLILTVTGLIPFGQIKSQPIEIGQDAELIKNLIELETRGHNKPDSYGRTSSHWTWDVKYKNGKILDIMQCHKDELLIEYKIIGSYCKHYIIGDDYKLAYVLTQYENVSTEKIKEFYEKCYLFKKNGELFFSEDFEHYSKIYLAENGSATVEWRATIISELPTNMQSNIKTKLTTLRTEKTALKTEETAEAQIKEGIEQHERLFTILYCEDFNDGLALVACDIKNKTGGKNYGSGKKLFGYINDKGEYVIEPKYEKAFSFSDGFALVTTNPSNLGDWEYINTKGEDVFNKKFADAQSFHEGLAAVREEKGSYGFIDKTGNFISKPQYEKIGDFHEGLARIKFQDRWGYIDKAGKEIVYPQFTDARDFSEGLAMVRQYLKYGNNQYSYIDKTGKVAIKLGLRDEPVISSGAHNSYERDKDMEFPSCDFHNGMVMISLGGAGGENVFIDKTSKTLIKVKDPYANSFHYNEGLALAQTSKGLTYGYLNDKGKWAIESIFEDAGNFHEGLAKVKLNDNWGFIDLNGNVVINKEILKSKADVQANAPYDAVSDFTGGLAIVQTRKRFGYIDKLGNWVIQPEFIGAYPFKNGIARVKMPDRKGWNYIDKSGKILFTNFL